jgi:polar amino acid transport system substrate-binding protein
LELQTLSLVQFAKTDTTDQNALMNRNSQISWLARLSQFSRLGAHLGVLILTGALAACASPPVTRTASGQSQTLAALAPAEVIKALAPTGVLRVGAYPGSPTSMVREAHTGAQVGITFELGRLLAQRLGVPMQLVEFSRVAQVLEGVKSGGVDFTFTNATEIRAKDMNFAQSLVKLELGYLVPIQGSSGTAIAKLDEIDRPGIRVGVSQGSSSQSVLGRQFKSAVLVPADSLKQAQEMLAQGRIDAFATNKAILFEMADGLKGVKVLDGRWGIENLAIAIQKDVLGREAALEYLRRFGTEMQSSGELAAMIKRAGLKGVAAHD